MLKSEGASCCEKRGDHAGFSTGRECWFRWSKEGEGATWSHTKCAHSGVSTEGFTPAICAHFVLNATSLQLIPAYSAEVATAATKAGSYGVFGEGEL
jgi:hypothetical protein